LGPRLQSTAPDSPLGSMMPLTRDEDFACPGQSGHGAEWPVSAIRS
jgi:hypothetical protein